ncbi:32738_t:CDS:1, partial [Racocetra persica]
ETEELDYTTVTLTRRTSHILVGPPLCFEDFFVKSGRFSLFSPKDRYHLYQNCQYCLLSKLVQQDNNTLRHIPQIQQADKQYSETRI